MRLLPIVTSLLLSLSLTPSTTADNGSDLPHFCLSEAANHTVTLTCHLTKVTHKLLLSSVQQWVAASVITMATVEVKVECSDSGAVVELPLLLDITSLHHVTVTNCLIAGALSSPSSSMTSRDDRRQVRLRHCTLLPDTVTSPRQHQTVPRLFMGQLQVLQLSNISVLHASGSDVITLLTSLPSYPRLTDLDLSGNTWLTKDSWGMISSKGGELMPVLHSLNLSSTGLQAGVSTRDYPLLHSLDLSHTPYTRLPELEYHGNRPLTINMSDTHFMTFTLEDPLLLAHNEGLVLDLGHNDIVCSCEQYDTVHRLQTHRLEFAHLSYLDDLMCRVTNTSQWQRMLSMTKEDMCERDDDLDVIRVLVVVCGVLVAVLVVCVWTGPSLANFVRRYTITRACTQARCDVIPANRALEAGAHYDVLLSFCDCDWQERVKPFICWASVTGLRLCAHVINMAAGGSASANICAAVMRSRCVVIFVSRDFLSDPWCRLHLLASMQPRDLHQRLVLVRTDSAHLPSISGAQPAPFTHLASWLADVPTLAWHKHGLEGLTREVTNCLRLPRNSPPAPTGDLSTEALLKTFPLGSHSGTRVTGV